MTENLRDIIGQVQLAGEQIAGSIEGVESIHPMSLLRRAYDI